MLQLYGNPRSRAMRCLWMLEEVGQPYQLVDKSLRADDLHSADYLKLNPNARIPTLVDGDVVLWESMAINLYLAQKYPGPMHCADAAVLGHAAQWSFWAMLEVEMLLLHMLEHRVLLAEHARDISVVERNELLLKKPLGILNGALAGRSYHRRRQLHRRRPQRRQHSVMGQDRPARPVGLARPETLARRVPGAAGQCAGAGAREIVASSNCKARHARPAVKLAQTA